MTHRAFTALLLLTLFGITARADDSGYLGVILSPLPAGTTPGAVIQEIFKDSPADRDGLRSGDLVISVNDQEIMDAQGLLDVTKFLKADQKARLKVRRADEKELKEIAVTLTARPDKPLTEIPLKKRPSLGIAFSVQPDGSLMVANFLADSPAEKAGLQTGDIITSIAGHETKSYASILSCLAAQKDGAEAKIQVTRNGQTQELAVTMKDVLPKYKQK